MQLPSFHPFSALGFATRGLIVLFLALFYFQSSYAQTPIYRDRDASGVVTYSDEPQSERSESVDLPPLPGFYSPEVDEDPEQSAAEQDEETAADYQLELIRPVNEQVIHAANGAITIETSLQPAMTQGMCLQVLVDDQLARGWPVCGTETKGQVLNVDRGSHQISAVLFDANGQVLAISNAATVFLHRASRLINPAAR